MVLSVLCWVPVAPGVIWPVMMQCRAEMPKSVGQGVSLGLHGAQQVQAAGVGHWPAKLAVAESSGRKFLSVNISCVCDVGVGCFVTYCKTVWKVWSAEC
jgi:hypothetical protein